MAPRIEPKIGDVVRLKSGGPLMTCGAPFKSAPAEAEVYCYWFVEGELKRQPFPAWTLDVVPASERRKS